MLCCDVVDVVEDSSSNCISLLLGSIRGNDHGRLDGNCGHILILALVGASGDRQRGVVRAACQDLLADLAVDRNEVSVIGGRKLSDRRSRSACNDERCVDLAVLEAFRGIREAQVLGLDGVFAEACRSQDVDRVEVNAGARSADGN